MPRTFAQHSRRGRKGRTIQLVFFMILLLCVGLLFIQKVRRSASSQVISPLAGDVEPKQQLSFIFPKDSPKPKTNDYSGLMVEIRNYIETQKGTFSVYIYDLNKEKGYGLNETTVMNAASINKLPILAALYYESQNNTQDLDDRITLQASDIQNYGTGTLRYQGPGGVYSLKTLAQLLIEKSDNTAAYVLTTVIGEKRIQELVDSWGLTQTDIHNNKTSNKDVAILLIKMYKSQITNTALTQEMIGFMDDTDFENRLSGLLPQDITVYHKIGTEVNVIHDVGIVQLLNNPYYIGVMINDVVDDGEAEAAIAHISKLAYDFISKLQ